MIPRGVIRKPEGIALRMFRKKLLGPGGAEPNAVEFSAQILGSEAALLCRPFSAANRRSRISARHGSLLPDEGLRCFRT